MNDHAACFRALERLGVRAESGVVFLGPQRDVLFVDETARRAIGAPVQSDLRVAGNVEFAALRDAMRDETQGWNERRWLAPKTRQPLLTCWYAETDSSDVSVVFVETEEAVNRAAERVRNMARGREFHRLARRLAHDVGTPLNALHLELVVLERLIAGAESTVAESRAELLQIVHTMSDQIRRIDGLAREFVDAVAPVPPPSAPADLSDTLRRAVAELAPVRRCEGIKCELIGADRSFIADLRGDSLAQGLVNLQLAAIETMLKPRLRVELCVDPDKARVIFSATAKESRFGDDANAPGRKRAQIRSAIALEDIEENGGRMIGVIETPLDVTYEIEYTRSNEAVATS